MEFDNSKVYGDTPISDGLVFTQILCSMFFLHHKKCAHQHICIIMMKVTVMAMVVVVSSAWALADTDCQL